MSRPRSLVLFLILAILAWGTTACSSDPPGWAEAGAGTDGTSVDGKAVTDAPPPAPDVKEDAPRPDTLAPDTLPPDTLPPDTAMWPDSSAGKDARTDGYRSAPFGCRTDADCFGIKCCATPWGIKLCAPSCP